jgi:hypothetical protein
MVMERGQCMTVRRHCVVREEAAHDLPQPFPLFGDGLMPTLPQLLLHLFELRLDAVASRLPMKQELPLSRLATDEGEPQEVEGLRFTKTSLDALGRGIAAERDQAGLIRM